MQVEHVAGVGLASGRSLEQQGKLAVSGGLLAEVVVYYQDVLALVHEVFAHGRARIGRDIEHRRGRGCACRNYDGIVHCAEAAQLFNDSRDGGLLLTYGNIDADDVLILLVYYSVQRDGGLAGLTVADNKLALAAADGHERIDRLEARLHGNGHGLSGQHTGRGAFNGSEPFVFNGPLAVDGIAHCIDNTPYHTLANRDFDYTSGTADTVALLKVAEGSEQNDAHVILFKVLYHALESALELEHLTRHNVGKAGYAAYTVTKSNHLTGLEYVDVAVDLLKLILDAFGN